jgi:hypothetical protein
MNQEPHTLADLLTRARQALADPQGLLPAASAAATAEAVCVVFFAIGEGSSRARVASGRGDDIEAAWQQATRAVTAIAKRAAQPPQRLRAEIVDKVEALTWGALKAKLAQTKRNYFNLGIALDARSKWRCSRRKCTAAPCSTTARSTTPSPTPATCTCTRKRRFGREIDFPTDDGTPVWCFTTRAVYVDAEGAWPITAEGQAAGFRALTDWNAPQVHALVDDASAYLAAQVKPTGEFHYGWFPCFDRAIPTYNTLRHASSTYAMLEAWELSAQRGDEAQGRHRPLAGLPDRHADPPRHLPDGTRAAYLLDVGSEIKLGGNAVCLLALVKYTELTGDQRTCRSWSSWRWASATCRTRRPAASCTCSTRPRST